MEEFINKLASLCDEYKASLWYSVEDDGVLVTIGDQTVSIGWPSGEKPGDQILDKVLMKN